MVISRALLPWVLGCILWALSATSGARVAVDVSGELTSLAAFVEICEDSSNQLKLPDIERGRCSFAPANTGSAAKGFTASDWWARVNLVNTKPEALTRWISVGHPKISLVRLYYRGTGTGNAVWTEQTSGLSIPAAKRPVIAATAVLPIRLEAGQEVEMLVRISSKSALDLSMFAWESHKYLSTYQQMQLIHAVALGGLLMTGLFALAIFFQFKDRTFLFYGLAMWCEIGVELINSGVWPQYLWPPNQPFMLELLPICVAGAVVGFTLFLHSFIGNLSRFPTTLRLFHTSVAVLLAGLIWAVTVQYRQGGLVWSLSVVFMLFFSLALITQAAWQGSRQARLLMLTTSAICLLELLRLGVTLGLNSTSITMIASAPWAFVLTAPAVLAGISRHSREMHDKYVLEKRTGEIRSQFLARVGHDLRAPLSTILGFSRMLETNSLRTTPSEAGVVIGHSGKLLLRQIDDLLDFARLDVGQLRLHLKPFVLATWLEEIRINAELMSQLVGNRFHLEVDHLPEVVLADADRLNQVLTNLLSNANRATTDGHITLTCKARDIEADRTRIGFAVTDTGVGIAPSDQSRIFEAFEQGTDAHSKQLAGIGLGLSIARNLVETMGGKITLKSEVGQGSRFAFSIDCALVTEEGDRPAPASLSPDLAIPQDVVNNGKCILVVDDKEEDCLHLRNMLVRAGYQVRLADSAKAAMEEHCQTPDAVITDQYMLDGDGWQVLELFKQRYEDMPVILVSQAPPHPPIGWKKHVHFDATLTKPVSQNSICEILDSAFSQSAVRRPAESKLVELRKLIQAGEVTLIEQWARTLQASNPQFGAYSEQVLHALLRLDFDRLRTLSFPPS